MSQPHIQTLLNDYFEQLQRHLNLEFSQNYEQIMNYLKFPREVEQSLKFIEKHMKPESPNIKKTLNF